MLRLIFSDLRDHATTWICTFIVALACGYIGGWVVSIRETALFATEEIQWSLQNASSMMLIFSAVAGAAVLVSAANLTVSVQKRSYALWQLANLSPRTVSAVVFVQLIVVALLGALCGTLLTALSFSPLFPLVFGARQELVHTVAYVGVSMMPQVWLMVVALFFIGGFRGALNAGKTPPLTALREPDEKHMNFTWARIVIMLFLAVAIGWLYYAMSEAAPMDALSFSPFMLVLLVGFLITVAPPLFSVLQGVWTKLIFRRWNAWYLAKHTARYSLSTSTSVETPIMAGFGFVAGLFSIVGLMSEYAKTQGNFGTTGIDYTTLLLMLGGPVLLCAIGAAASVIMTAKTRTRDIALLTANGAKPSTLIASAVCEAFIHTITATLVGIVCVALSHALIASVLGLALFSGITFEAGFVVSFVGFLLVLSATLIPTFSALKQDSATVLSG